MNENEDIVRTELLVLRAMCVAPEQGSVRETGLRLLKDYQWRESLHQTLFHILGRFSTDDPEAIRSLLPSHLTRYGFPDVDYAALFVPHSLSKEKAEFLMARLKDSK